jgi:hypothetical protein
MCYVAGGASLILLGQPGAFGGRYRPEENTRTHLLVPRQQAKLNAIDASVPPMHNQPSSASQTVAHGTFFKRDTVCFAEQLIFLSDLPPKAGRQAAWCWKPVFFVGN